MATEKKQVSAKKKEGITQLRLDLPNEIMEALRNIANTDGRSRKRYLERLIINHTKNTNG